MSNLVQINVTEMAEACILEIAKQLDVNPSRAIVEMYDAYRKLNPSPVTDREKG